MNVVAVWQLHVLSCNVSWHGCVRWKRSSLLTVSANLANTLSSCVIDATKSSADSMLLGTCSNIAVACTRVYFDTHVACAYLKSCEFCRDVSVSQICFTVCRGSKPDQNSQRFLHAYTHTYTYKELSLTGR